MNRSVLIPFLLVLAGCGDHDTAMQAALADTAGPSGPRNSETLPGSVPPPAASPASGYDLVLGEAVFTNTCLACHGQGAYNAPVLGNRSDWEARLQQDLGTLIQHAIHGHRRMPPKGGFFLLSDQEVAAAVAYAVDRSEKILVETNRTGRAPGCDPISNLDQCDASELEDMLTLQMLLLLAGNGGK